MKRTLVVVVLGTAALLGVFGSSAGADDKKDDKKNYPPTKCVLEVSRSTVSPGETITVSGLWPAAGLDVVIVLDPPGSVIGRATTGADRTFSIRVTIPAGQPAGHAKLIAADKDKICVATAVIIVTKAPVTVAKTPGTPVSPATPATPARALASTGSDSTGTIVAVAAAAVAIGFVLVFTARRRNRARSRIGA
jgi:LPXTG-motif cell wall-anchored protein